VVLAYLGWFDSCGAEPAAGVFAGLFGSIAGGGVTAGTAASGALTGAFGSAGPDLVCGVADSFGSLAG